MNQLKDIRNGESKVGSDVLDVVGIGAGPSNLSLAALLSNVNSITSRFYDRQKIYHWHEGLLLRDTYLQVNFLKDLVTPIDPTSQFSFLNFLVSSGRFYAFLTAEFERVLRKDYSEYLRWVSSRLGTVKQGCAVNRIRLQQQFEIEATHEVVSARAISVATGPKPNIPIFVRASSQSIIIHSSEFLTAPTVRCTNGGDQKVIIVGGGQSGAEIFHHHISDEHPPNSIVWISRRSGFPSLEESPFANEFFTPRYSEHFFQLSERARADDISQKKYLNDGISTSTMSSIYKSLYKLRYHSSSATNIDIHDCTEVVSIEESEGDAIVRCRNMKDGSVFSVEGTKVILCTGYKKGLPDVLHELCRGRVDVDSYEIDKYFRLRWDAPPSANIYLLNAGIQNYGIAEANLSITAWRAAVVTNHIAGNCVYKTQHDPTMLNFSDSSNKVDTPTLNPCTTQRTVP